MTLDLPDGATIHELQSHRDARGGLTEGFRSSWSGAVMRQFNIVVSEPNVLRGVHLHFDHHDHLVMVKGRGIVGLHDCREASSTFGLAATVALENTDVQLTVPPGVAHGFWFPAGGILTYGLDAEWSMADELGCRWDDSELGIDWGAFGDAAPDASPDGPRLSTRDATAGSLSLMIEQYAHGISRSPVGSATDH